MIPSLRSILVGCVLLGLTPGLRADHWQKSSDGYWYYWSDSDRCWYWQDGRDWWVLDAGRWVKWVPPSVRAAPACFPAPRWSVHFPSGSVSWGAGGQVTFPYGRVAWGPGGGYVAFPFGSVSWPGRGGRR